MVFRLERRNRFIAGIARAVRQGRVAQMTALDREYRGTLQRLRGAYENLRPELDRISQAVADNMTMGTVAEIRERVRVALDGFNQLTEEQARYLQEAGVNIGYRAGLNNLQAGGMRTWFNATQLADLQNAINYVDSAPFRNVVEGMADFYADRVGDQILRAIAEGRNPRWTAAQIKRYLVSSPAPLRDAVRLSRTTQIYSSRQTAHTTYRDNGINQWIWSAELGDRTCISCISLHGTVHPASETLNDHHLGRCAAIPITPTWASMGFEGGEEVVIGSGESWFADQPEGYQRSMLGEAAYEIYTQGGFRIEPGVLSTDYQNDIFGTMRRHATQGEIMQRVLAG